MSEIYTANVTSEQAPTTNTGQAQTSLVTPTDNSKKKKSKFTKFVFYIMALLLIATTALSVFMAYKVYIIEKNIDNDSSDKVPTSSDSNTTNFSLLDKDALEVLLKNASIEGQEKLLSSIKDMMEGGTSTLRLLRKLYPDKLVYGDTNGYVFKDINNELAMNNYDKNSFSISADKNGVPTNVDYYEGEKIVSYTGIDVSKHNGKIDWEKVAASGIDFAMIRVANRGYGTEGNLLSDERFAENAQAATENNIAIGAYIFSEAITIEEAMEEADLVLSLIEPYDITYPVVIDIEDIQGDVGRNENLTPTELTDIVLAFCNKIKDAGYTPMIYCNLKGFIGMLEFERLEGIEKWYAYYGNEMYFPYELSMWQYSSSGVVDGIEGNVDLNISFKNYK